MVTTLALTLAGFWVFATGGASMTAVAHPYRSYVTDQGSPTLRMYRPTSFTLAGDCRSWEKGMRWSKWWTHTKAVGRGIHVV
jgi:hypothetical protein